MTTNDVLRRIRYALSLTDEDVAALVEKGGSQISSQQVFGFTRREEDDGYDEIPDEVLGAFLVGLVRDRRGPPKPGTPPPSPELTPNTVLRSIRIALMLRDDDMLRMLKAGGHTMSKSELSALFRRPDHKHYRDCGHQVLRKFLRGLTLELRGDSEARGR